MYTFISIYNLCMLTIQLPEMAKITFRFTFVTPTVALKKKKVIVLYVPYFTCTYKVAFSGDNIVHCTFLFELCYLLLLFTIIFSM